MLTQFFFFVFFVNPISFFILKLYLEPSYDPKEQNVKSCHFLLVFKFCSGAYIKFLDFVVPCQILPSSALVLLKDRHDSYEST